MTTTANDDPAPDLSGTKARIQTTLDGVVMVTSYKAHNRRVRVFRGSDGSVTIECARVIESGGLSSPDKILIRCGIVVMYTHINMSYWAWECLGHSYDHINFTNQPTTA